MWLDDIISHLEWDTNAFFTFTMNECIFSIQRQEPDKFFIIAGDKKTGKPLGEFYSDRAGLQSRVERVIQNKTMGITVVDETIMAEWRKPTRMSLNDRSQHHREPVTVPQRSTRPPQWSAPPVRTPSPPSSPLLPLSPMSPTTPQTDGPSVWKSYTEIKEAEILKDVLNKIEEYENELDTMNSNEEIDEAKRIVQQYVESAMNGLSEDKREEIRRRLTNFDTKLQKRKKLRKQ